MANRSKDAEKDTPSALVAGRLTTILGRLPMSTTARNRHRGPVVLIGKSMGSRIGCHLSLEQHVNAVVCLGYPLVGIGKSGKIRDEVLLALTTPILFVQGTRDRLCPLDLLAQVNRRMQAPHAIHLVESGDHSLRATKTWLKAQGESQDDVDGRSAQLLYRDWLTSGDDSIIERVEQYNREDVLAMLAVDRFVTGMCAGEVPV